jgi:hypothetical protein
MDHFPSGAPTRVEELRDHATASTRRAPNLLSCHMTMSCDQRVRRRACRDWAAQLIQMLSVRTEEHYGVREEVPLRTV